MLCEKAKEILMDESNVQVCCSPVSGILPFAIDYVCQLQSGRFRSGLMYCFKFGIIFVTEIYVNS